MPLTLEEARAGLSDKVSQEVVDEFRRSSVLLDSLTFDDAVNPGTGSSTMTYGYMQLKTPSAAAFRALNTEYTPNEAKKQKKTADLKIFGGAASIDRVLAQAAPKELEFQLQEQIKAARNLFHYAAINGNSAADVKEFDGLSKLLTGASTEYNADSADGVIDVSNSQALETNYKTLNDMLYEFLSGIDGKPTMFLGNSLIIARLKSVANRLGYLSRTENAFGVSVSSFDNIALVDLGYYYSAANKQTLPCVPISDDGTTDLYAVTLGLDAFHGISLAGQSPIKTYLPDLNAPNAVKRAEVEMTAGVVLKNTTKAGVFRNIKVKAVPSTQKG